LKWTFEDLLPCYYYTEKTNNKTIRSQVWQPAPADGSAASQKIWGVKKFGGPKCLILGELTLFCFVIPSLKAQMTIRRGAGTAVGQGGQ